MVLLAGPILGFVGAAAGGRAPSLQNRGILEAPETPAVPPQPAALRRSPRWFGGLVLGSSVLLLASGGRAEQGGKPAAVPALYATLAEAEQAAKLHFHCTGAHRMGQQWMPCSQHGQQHQQHH